MATRGIEIRALGAKLQVIAEVLHEAKILTKASRPDFAAHAKISYERLKAAWDQERSRVSQEVHDRICEGAKFSKDELTWIDKNVAPKDRHKPDDRTYSGRDTVENFRKMLRECYGLGTLTVQIKHERPKLRDSNLLTFHIDDAGQTSSDDQPIALFLMMNVRTGDNALGFSYGFRRLRLRMTFKEDSAIRTINQLGIGNVVLLGQAKLAALGDFYNTEWTIEAAATVLNGELATKEAPLCQLAGFGIDEQFQAEVSFRMLDGSLVAPDGSNLSDPNLRHILEILSAKEIAGAADSQGWMSLGLQTLSVVRASRT